MRIFFDAVRGLLCFGIVVCAIPAQKGEAQLNQVELMKQFIGIWSTETVKDTSRVVVSISPFGSAMEGTVKFITRGKTISEGRWLWGYNEESDNYIAAEISTYSPDIALYTYLFTSKNVAEKVALGEFSNPDPVKSRFEFRSPDLIIQTVLKGNKLLNTFTIARVRN